MWTSSHSWSCSLWNDFISSNIVARYSLLCLQFSLFINVPLSTITIESWCSSSCLSKFHGTLNISFVFICGIKDMISKLFGWMLSIFLPLKRGQAFPSHSWMSLSFYSFLPLNPNTYNALIYTFYISNNHNSVKHLELLTNQ